MIAREVEQNVTDTEEAFGKLYEDYKRGSETIISLKEKYQNMQSLLSVEEDRIRNTDVEVAQL